MSEQEPKSEIEPGQRWRHEGEGGLYEVTGFDPVPDATNYEETGQIERSVLYTQLYDGDYPTGQSWRRVESSFLKHFTRDTDDSAGN